MKKRLLLLLIIGANTIVASENSLSSKYILSSIFMFAAKASWRCLAFPFKVTDVDINARFLEINKESDAKIEVIQTKCDELMQELQQEAQIQVAEIKSEISYLSRTTNCTVSELMTQVESAQQEDRKNIQLLQQQLQNEKVLRAQEDQKHQEEVKQIKASYDKHIKLLNDTIEKNKVHNDNIDNLRRSSFRFNQSLAALETNYQKVNTSVCALQKDNNKNNTDLISYAKIILLIEAKNKEFSTKLNGYESQFDTVSFVAHDINQEVCRQKKLIEAIPLCNNIQYIPITQIGLSRLSFFSKRKETPLAIEYHKQRSA